MVFIIYISNTLQTNLLVKNVLSVINQEKVHNIKVAIQLEIEFITNKDRRGLYKSYERQYEYQNTSHNHMKVITVYCDLRFLNILDINLLIDFSSDPDQKYLTSGTQQRFVPAPGACILYQPHIYFSLYIED